MSRPSLAVALALALTAPAAAQDDPALSHRVCGLSYSAENPFSWESMKTRQGLKDKLSPKEAEAAADALLAGLHASPRQRDAARLAAFVERAQGALKDGKPCCEQFLPKDMRKPDERKRKLALFEGAVPLYDCGEENENAAQLDELRHAAEAYVKLGRSRVSGFQKEGVGVIQTKNDEYDRMLFEGFPMFPWEALVNGALMSKDVMKGPPRHLLVLMHPSAGGEAQVGLRESRLAGALAVEPVGWVHYPKSGKHRTWWGVSALTTFRNDMGIGVGASARYDNFLLGVVWHDSNADKRLFDSKPFIFIGMDLYQFAGKKIRRYEAIKEKVSGALKPPTEPR